jgi:hypothetical protein
MLRAALFGEMDPVTGVSANIMTGQPIRGGTSFSHVLLDEAAMSNLIATSPAPKKSLERTPILKEEMAVERSGCKTEDLRIPTALPAMIGATETELPDMEIVLVD